MWRPNCKRVRLSLSANARLCGDAARARPARLAAQVPESPELVPSELEAFGFDSVFAAASRLTLGLRRPGSPLRESVR